MRLHVRAPAGPSSKTPRLISPASSTRSAASLATTRSTSMLDNIGLPYSGINIALSDTATVGPMDGEILDLAEGEAHAHRRPHGRPAPRVAAAVSRDAVLLSAGGHRQPGVELRPAGADRHSRVRPAPRHRLDDREQNPARLAARSGHRRRTHLPGARCPGDETGRRSHARAARWG